MNRVLTVSSHHAHQFVHPAFDLVNSNHGQDLGLPDVLDDEQWLAEYLRHWNLEAAGYPGPRDRNRLCDLRDRLRRIVDRLAGDGGQLTATERTEVDDYLRLAVYRRRFAEGDNSPVLVSERYDWDWALAELAGSFVEVVAGEGARRIKTCANSDCRFAFYDATKNRSRRWCDERTCGNRFKVRRFRARQREAGQQRARRR